MKKAMALAATLLAMTLVAQAKADELGDRAAAWCASIVKVNGKASSTNDWGGAAADAIIDAILAKPVDTITYPEAAFLHTALNAHLVTPEKRASRKPIVAYLQSSKEPKCAIGGKNAELIVFSDEARTQQLMTELAGLPAAANAVWEAARRLGHLGPAQQTYCEPFFRTLIAKGCSFPPYQKFFLAQLAGMNPIQARRAIRAEQDALLSDIETPMTDAKKAWLDELELRVKVAKSKAQDPQ